MEHTIIIKEKTEGGALKLAAIVAIVATSPFWFVLGVVLIGCVAGVVNNGGAWPYLALLVFSLLPVIRDRLSGKYDSKKLQHRIDQLELEASETRLHLLQLQESLDFDTTLKLHSEQNVLKTGSESQTSSRLVEAGSRKN